MKYKTLGATGMVVSEYALGAMMFGARGNRDHDDATRILHAALDAGITFVDTADVYSHGESEEIVGAALTGRRDDVILATKFGMPMDADPNHRGASRRWIVREVEDSLRRLRTDYLDLYQLHRYDYSTAIDETLSALTDLVQAGKIRAFGSSKFPAAQIVEAQWAAERGGHQRFRTEQPLYSIFNRRLETHDLPAAQRYGMGVLTFSPLSGGWLSGRADVRAGHRVSGRPSMYDPTTEAGRRKVAALTELSMLAEEAGMTLPRLAIGFVLSHPGVTSVLIGPRTREQLDTLLFADENLALSHDLLDRIDEIVPPGTDLDPADNFRDEPPSITDKATRRL